MKMMRLIITEENMAARQTKASTKKTKKEPAEKAKPKKKKVQEEKVKEEEKPSGGSGLSIEERFALMDEQRSRRISIITFGLGILMALMIFIPGTSGWYKVHTTIMGLFGVSAFFVPIILVYVSVLMGNRENRADAGRKFWWGFFFILLTSAVIQVFAVGKLPAKGFLKNFGALFEEGAQLHGGGVAGYLFAGPLLHVFGTTGARIISLLLVFIGTMLASGKTIPEYFRWLMTPFFFIGNCIAGVNSLMLGGTFNEGFYGEDDEEDDDSETDYSADYAINRNSIDMPIAPPVVDDFEELDTYRGDLEALNLLDPAPVEPLPQVNTEPRGIPDEDGFIFDVPLPGEEGAPVFPEPKPLPPLKRVMRNEPVLSEPVPENVGGEEKTDADDELDMLINQAAEKKAKRDAAAAGELIDDEPREIPQQIYILPGLDLLALPDVRSNSAEAAQEMREKADTIVNTFKSFGVEVKIRNIFRGPSITRYEIQPGAGVKVSKIKGLEDDIALNLAAQGVRIEAPVPGKSVVGIEVPNINKDTVTIREILASTEFKSAQSKLAFAVGKDITGNSVVGDIAKMPHVIIAGTTGSGKSVCTRSIIMSLLYNATPEEVRIILIDPKIVEFKVFEGIPHLLTPIVTDAKKAPGALNWAVMEMMRRYQTFADVNANDLRSYNELAEMEEDMEKLPQIVIFIDELADMMLVAGKEVEDSICRLAQMGRAAGMHLVIATQRPTTDVITGLIKANIPSRIALSVMSQVDSRTIIDMAGADKLLGNGDMLYMPIGIGKPKRVQGCFASSSDIEATLNFIKEQGTVQYDEGIMAAVESYTPQTKGSSGGSDMNFEAGSDEDFTCRAIDVAVGSGGISVTMLQKKLKLGYARASRIMDDLEEMGVVGPSEGSRPRKVYWSREQFEQWKLNSMEN